MNARKLYESERAAAEASLARASAEHASISERGTSRVRELEEALKRAARDYKKLERERHVSATSVANFEDAMDALRNENARLASAASRMEDEAKRRKESAERAERDLASARAALRKAEEEFVSRLARDRRAWEQAAVARGEYVEFDPYARGDRDGRPKQPPKGGRDENEPTKRNGDVREGELFFGTGTGDGDFRNGIALGGGEDFAPGERSGGAGAAGDGFFEGLVFRER